MEDAAVKSDARGSSKRSRSGTCAGTGNGKEEKVNGGVKEEQKKRGRGSAGSGTENEPPTKISFNEIPDAIFDQSDPVDPFCDPKAPKTIHFEDVTSAAFMIKDGILNTPCMRSQLSDICGMEIYLKKDFLQVTGSFKERGARYALMMLSPEQKEKGVISASLGNHALALCYHGKSLGIPVTVVMPVIAPIMKIQACWKLKATVIVKGNDMGEAKKTAMLLAEEKKLCYINGYDHPHIMAGQGTIGLEVMEQVPDLDAVVVPVGGGGLIAGVATAVKALKPHVKIIGLVHKATERGVEPSRNSVPCHSQNTVAADRNLLGELLVLDDPAIGAAGAILCSRLGPGGSRVGQLLCGRPSGWPTERASGRPTAVSILSTLADGLAVPTVGYNAFVTARKLIDKMVVIGEEWVAIAILRLVELEKSVVEGAGATGLAAILAECLEELRGKKVVVLLCGGNIDTTVLGRCLERGLAADGRLLKFTVCVSDRPGGIAELTRMIADIGVSVKDIMHDRAWLTNDLYSVKVKVICETRDLDHSKQLMDLLSRNYDRVHFGSIPSPAKALPQNVL